jgi:hypothetical protein
VGAEQGLGEHTVPPPFQVSPAFVQSAWVWLGRQNPLVEQHAPVGGGQLVVEQATPVPR